MNVHKKTIIAAVLVIAVIGAMAIQIKNKTLFKGQIFNQDKEIVNEVSDETVLPDLKPKLEIIYPEDKTDDITANVTIENAGQGGIDGNTPFKYAVYLNDTEIFSNVDSYTIMTPGDSFNFDYPISKLIYNYSGIGKVRVEIDTEDAIAETNEDNNTIELNYNL